MNTARICLNVLLLLLAGAGSAFAAGAPPADPSWLHFLLMLLVLGSGIALIVALTRALGGEKSEGDPPARRRRP